ncbi:MAG TPA: N-acyl homoserine lactonase family protein [Chitinophagaceae bacterium]|nr:N-acyl homoserine lactonase family protein [Chitinophagaceae bacterium]
MFPSHSISLTSNGKPVTVHLVSTGAVTVKTKFREAKRTGLPAMIEFMLDKNFTEWMPIWCMIIEHHEGVFVIDTGENANVNDKNYFKSSGMFANWFDTTQFKFKVERNEEIDRQLQQLNIPIEKIKSVVLTHLHLDHVDGIRHFPNTPIIVNRNEWNKPFGDLPKLYPSWFKPTLVDLNESFDVFEHAHFLTEAKDIVMVHTPGHTWHHCSVILKTDTQFLFFGADICYDQQQLINEKYSGTNCSHKLAQQTYNKVKAFCSKNSTVYIPSHEAAAGERLEGLEIIKV